MNLYIFRELLKQPTVKSLISWREQGDTQSYYNVCSELIKLRLSLKQYISTLLLESPLIEISEFSLPYFEKDIDEIYNYFMAFNFDNLCEKSSLFPLPSTIKCEKNNYISKFQETLDKLTNATSSLELRLILVEFFEQNACADEAKFSAFQWSNGTLCGVLEPDDISFDDLAVLEYKKEPLIANTEAFLSGYAANDVLLVGASGTGKSSSVKAVFNMFKPKGLKLVEIFKDDLCELPLLMSEIRKRKHKYIIFIDDLSFEAADMDYKAIKVALDGQIETRPKNVLIYATSNRLHLVKETWKDREGAQEIHENDTLNEKMSLSERFGIRLYFSALSQPEYFEIVRLLLSKNGLQLDRQTEIKAATWALENNGRSGRTAKQFVTHIVSKDVSNS